jgi:large subunit ribosomal protein L7/L12|tara:strand:+ start:124 stop:525 length:402 start_codon:yes stop_codon:yes gene_type:complete
MEEVVAKAKVSTEDLIEQIEGMSVLELANLVKELEEKFGVSAQAMAAPMMVAGAGAGAAEAEEQSAFDVVLTSFGEKKINVIKVVREVTSLGLKEAKDLVDNLPNPVKEGIEKDEADELAKKFQDAGAEVEVK